MSNRAKKVFLFIGILTGLISACLGLETSHSNHLGWALLFAGTGLTAIGCISLGILFVQAGEDQKNTDRSLWLPCFSALVICLITPIEYLYLPSDLPHSERAQDIGMILLAGALAFYILSLQSKKPWRQSESARGRKQLTLLSTLVCPISASLLLFGIGLGVGYSSWIGLLLSLVLLAPGLQYRRQRTNRWSHL